MCGIFGIISLREGYSPDPDLLGPMAEITYHRGPDDQGSYHDRRIAMAMRRLSIIDVDHGRQPIANEDQTLWIVCNGEIYNFRELRRSLSARGHRFATGSDTEVILHLYEEHGLACVDHLEGMFAFALWDTTRRRLFIARDRLGIKPLYYHRDAKCLIFASEAKAILTVPGVERDVDPIGLQEYLTFGHTPTDRSLFKGIEKLPPASLIVCQDGKIEQQRYWHLPHRIDEQPSEAQWAERIHDEIESAVVSQMVSDVPLGAFLSGGIDSSAIVAMMAKHSSEPVKTYSIGFDTGAAGAFYNELPHARQVVEMFNTEHREILVRPDVVSLLPKLLWHMDEPVSDSALITTYLVSEFAREDVTVILSGVGGDELFGGYIRYLGDYYARQYHRLPRWLRYRIIAPLVRILPSDRHSRFTNLTRYARAFVGSSESSSQERYRSYIEVFGGDTLDRLLTSARKGDIDSLDRAFMIACDGDSLNRLMRVDLETQMPNDLLMLTDKMTMAASLECRVPFLNHELVELAAGLPAGLRIHDGKLKSLLKRALADVLPASILQRKKRGFGAPIGSWFKRELEPLMRHLLSRRCTERRGLMNWQVIEETKALHASGKEDHTDHLLALLNFEIWAQLYLDGRSPGDLAEEFAREIPA